MRDGRAGLEHRRDLLTQQVAELHWDLGGLAYEMAIRDHFRLDVLVRRAAMLQECDAELAEIERLLHARQDGGAGGGPETPTPTAGTSTGGAPAGTSTGGARGGLRVPSPRASALLVLVFVGFGVLLGNVARSRVNATLASSRSPLRVVLPRAATAPSSTSAETTPAASTSEPPAAAAQETPAPAASNPAPASKRASGDDGGGATTQAEAGGGGAASGRRGSSKAAAGAPAKTLPPIKHVFVIMLSNEPYASVFGPSSAAPYLSGTLEREGELLVRYDAVAHEQLADEAALISGQGPTAETAANCPNYTEIAAGSSGANEQVLGTGCVYPRTTRTLAGQLAARRLSWRAYVQGIDEAGAQAGACAHPVLGQQDTTADQAASTGPYATFRNPFVYFASVLDSPECSADDVGLASLKGDLRGAKDTPNFAYVVPDRCHDGNPTPCTPGAPAGMGPADAFLKEVVPQITASKAYKQNGLLVITVDEAPSSGPLADSSSCCGQPLFPNAPSETLGGAPRGGGTVGALLLSPYVKAGGTNAEPFNHFSLLRTIEDLFGLGHLGYAGLSSVRSFEPAMFTAGKD